MNSDAWLKHIPEVRKLVRRHIELNFPLRVAKEKLTFSARITERKKIHDKLAGWGFNFYDYQIKQLGMRGITGLHKDI